MEGVNFQKIEKKWQDRWEKKRLFEAEIDRRKKKFFVNFPYPYINGYSHIGHLFSLMRVEAFTRYKRAAGFNVLFPQGWHATGSPILNAAKRIKDKEPKQIKIMKDMGIKESDIKKFEEPKYWLDFFAPKYKKDYISLGMSIDWRREFYTTSLNPYYNKFIEWQFRKLKEKGYCIKGHFPVVWDPKENAAVGDHDRIEGEGVTTQDFIWVKFRMKDSDLILMAGTTRPDALFGQSNLWIDPEGDYVVVRADDEKWVVGKETFYKIENQYKKAKIIGKITPKELIGKWFKGPLVEREIYSLPAWFIDSSVGSGIVYSALEDPVDLLQLQKIQADPNMVKDYNLDLEIVKKLKPIDIITVSGMGDNLGQEIAKEFGVEGFDDKRKLEEAKGELNRRVFRKGVMKKRCGECAGMSVQNCQKFLKKKLVKDKAAVMFYELTGKVISRSLAECVVKVVDDQWFLNYADSGWKKKTYECLNQLKLYPEKARQQFDYVIGWLHEWACTRKEGLGTRLPWDEKWLIESLSDSTIYMAYYTVAHLIKKMPLKEINDNFFDYIFLGKGKGKNKWKKLKEEFEYWYPVDFRNSGKDLIQNHLAFFLFNHVAIFSKKNWPKGIGVNGWVTIDGRKMSKSLGNMIPIKDMVKEFGADISRLTILNGGEDMDDPNWDSKFARILGKKFESLNELIQNYNKGKNNLNKIDKWMKNRLAIHVNDATEFMEKTLFRSAIQKIFFDLISDLRWYLRRTNSPNKKTLNQAIESFIIMIQPFCPHLAEELWEKIGKKEFVSLESWPRFKVIKFEDTEATIKKLIGDVRNLLNLVKKNFTKAFIYVIPKEEELYKGSADFLSKELGLKIEIQSNNKRIYDPMDKSQKAKLGRPSIYLE